MTKCETKTKQSLLSFGHRVVLEDASQTSGSGAKEGIEN